MYLLQRGDDVNPFVVVDRNGHDVRSWGKGTHITAHAIRVDTQGNTWTVDAATSVVRKYAPEGQLVMQIDVGGRPAVCMDQQVVPESERPIGADNFCGATDVAFAPYRHVFTADGYANNRTPAAVIAGELHEALVAIGITLPNAGVARFSSGVRVREGLHAGPTPRQLIAG